MLRNTCSANVFAFGVVALRWELLFLQHNVYTHRHMREFVVDIFGVDVGVMVVAHGHVQNHRLYVVRVLLCPWPC